MRKILMALAACALTGAVQAAGTVAVNFGTGYSGWSVWAVSAFNNTRPQYDLGKNVNAPWRGYTTKYEYETVLESAATPAEKLTYLNAAYDTDYVGTWQRGWSDMNFTKVDASGVSTAQDNGGQYSWLFVLVEQVDDAGHAVEGTRYAVIQAPEQESVVTYSTPGDYSTAQYSSIANGYSVANDTLVVLGGYNAIPEPTSGLLLLLGVAGLALKRRRA